ncbi:MAG: hypothetical protein PHV12_05295 [Bacteroidales bacterium]|jgi:hypothetical protein|nr:hypothetical protein [Bacteroidales bacterium]MDD3273519.1 hypothetical protein [Bacteroidales bacterium]
MKKILLIAIGILFLASSCEPERTLYKLGDGAEASFPSTIVKFLMVASDNNQFQVEMWRGNTKSAASIPVTITGTAGKFTPSKQSFDFAAGENKAIITFTYDDLASFGGEAYNIKLTMANEADASKGGNKAITVTAQRKLTFQSLGTGSFTSEFFEESWPQEVMKAAEANYYRMPNLYYNNYPIEFTLENNVIGFAKQPMGYVHSTYGMVYWDPKYVEYCEVNGNELTFVVEFSLETVTYGYYYEVLEMPE